MAANNEYQLPANVSPTYYAKTNTRFLWLLWAHLPLSLFTAYMSSGNLTLALSGSLLILSVPSILHFFTQRHLEIAVSHAVALVSFSALLIRLSGGMTEMHFHIFTSLGLLIVLAQPAAVVSALLIVVVHHVGFFFLLPKSLLSYDAGFGILVIHALFALSIGIPSFFISRKYREYIVGVNGMAMELTTIAGSMSESAAVLLKDSQTLSDSTAKEAPAVTETAASLEELNAMIEKNTAHAGTVAQLSSESKRRSTEGIRIVNEMVESFEKIQANSLSIMTTVGSNNRRMEKIVAMIEAIESKTKVINDIVFQTKLLSFNASVEAARAGEQGKGFAVVAQEVGNLAEMSGKSAKEISGLLESSTRDVRAILSETSSEIGSIVSMGKTQIDSSLAVAEKCRVILSEIDTSLGDVEQKASEIEVASKEQSAGVVEISRAMGNIELASQNNTEVSSRSSLTSTAIHDGFADLSATLKKLGDAVGESDAA